MVEDGGGFVKERIVWNICWADQETTTKKRSSILGVFEVDNMKEWLGK